jgi:PAS domain S-box-containing protein
MDYWFSIYIVLLAISLFLALALSLLSWQKRSTPYALPLAGCMAGVAVWALGGMIELALREDLAREWMHAVSYAAFLVAMACALQFAAAFSWGDHGISRFAGTLVWTQTLAGILVVLTNPWHRLVWSGIVKNAAESRLDFYSPVPLMLLLSTFSYGYAALAVWMLARIALRRKRPQSRQALTLLFAILIPAAAGILSFIQNNTWAGFDLTPAALILSCMLITLAVSRWGLFDLIPIARDLVIENMDEGVIVLDPRDRVVDLNPTAREMIGGDPPIRVGDSLAALLERLEPPDAQIWILPDSQMEVQSISRNGRWIEIRTSSLRTRQGELNGRLILLRDITERRTSEERTVLLSHEYQFALEHMQTNVFRLRRRPDGAMVYTLNEGPVPKRLGQLTEVVRGKTIEEVMGPELGRYLRPFYLKAFTGRPVSYEVDLGPLVLMTMLSPIFEESEVVELAGSSVDITGRIMAERELQQREAYQRALLDNLPFKAWLKDARGEYLAANQPQADALGVARPEDLRGRTDDDLRPPEIAKRIREEETEVRASGMRRMGEDIFEVGSDKRWMETFQAPIFDDEGAVIGTVGFSRDVTERKYIEGELENAKTLLESALDQTPIPMMMASVPDGILRIANPACRKYLGLPPDQELIGISLSDLAISKAWIDVDGQGRMISPEEFPLYLACQGQSTQNREYGIIRGDGMRRWELVTAVPIHNRAGEIIAAIMVFPDITETKLADALLISYAHRLERSNRDLQDFASSASHDLQEPLRKIQAFGERLNTRFGSVLDEDGRDYLARMIGASHRMQAMINALLDYSRVTTRAQPFVTVQLETIVQEAVADLEARITQTGGQVEAKPLPEIEADPLQMRLLFQNLVGNALKFHPPDTLPKVSIWADPPVERMITIHIQDNGIGFDPKYLDRIFHPFQRLHGRGEFEGSGMGLAICRKIVERHDGEITAHSTPGVGTTFLVTLPVSRSKGGMEL